jgi:ribosomal protein L3
MTKWKKYTGCDEQIKELKSEKRRICKYKDGTESEVLIWFDTYHHPDYRLRSTIQEDMQMVDTYLICEPHPYAGMIKRWADTGQPVWVRVGAMMREDQFIMYRTYRTTTPDWNIPGAEYSFTPFGN